MIQTAQPSIIFLNAPGEADPRRDEKGSGQMRCLFAALNDTACAVPALRAVDCTGA
jgi:hypothetical protein